MVFIGIIIREATKEDIFEIKAIARDVIKNNYKPLFGEDIVGRFIDSGVPDNYIALNLDCLKVAETENGVVGFCVLKGNTIDVIMVRPDFQKLSIDAHILNKLQNEYSINFMGNTHRKTQPKGFYVKTGLNKNKLDKFNS